MVLHSISPFSGSTCRSTAIGIPLACSNLWDFTLLENLSCHVNSSADSAWASTFGNTIHYCIIYLTLHTWWSHICNIYTPLKWVMNTIWCLIVCADSSTTYTSRPSKAVIGICLTHKTDLWASFYFAAAQTLAAADGSNRQWECSFLMLLSHIWGISNVQIITLSLSIGSCQIHCSYIMSQT